MNSLFYTAFFAIHRALDWRRRLLGNTPTERAIAIFSSRRLLSYSSSRNNSNNSCERIQGCVRWLEGGSRHRSIGTLVTSAEPRAERGFASLSAFVRMFKKQKKGKEKKRTNYTKKRFKDKNLYTTISGKEKYVYSYTRIDYFCALVFLFLKIRN